MSELDLNRSALELLQTLSLREPSTLQRSHRFPVKLLEQIHDFAVAAGTTDSRAVNLLLVIGLQQATTPIQQQNPAARQQPRSGDAVRLGFAKKKGGAL
jgi:hypothetical protein